MRLHIVLDPNGENYPYTSDGARRSDSACTALNFSATPGETASFNPLYTVRLGTEHEVADVQPLAQMIDGRQAERWNAHWAETSTALLIGAILHANTGASIASARGTEPTRGALFGISNCEFHTNRALLVSA